MNKDEVKGWLFAFLTAICWAIYAITMRVGMNYFDTINPTVFVLQALIISSFILLLISGVGRLSIDTIRNSFTWTYGTLQILNNVFLMVAFAYALTATSATLLLRVGIIIVAILGVISSKKQQTSSLGILCVAIGLIVVAMGLDAQTRNIAIFLVLLSAITQVMQVRIAANHKENNQATGDVKTELRVTGYIIAVTASVYSLFLFTVVMLNLQAIAPKIIPSMQEVFSLPSLGLATITGIFIISSMKYFEFTSTKHIGSTNFLSVVAFTPLLTFFCEKIALSFGLIQHSDISIYELAGGFLIVSGALLLIRQAIYKYPARISKKQRNATETAKDTIYETLGYFNDDNEKTAQALGISEDVLVNIIHDKKIYAINTLEKIKTNFAKNVATQDPITGLDSRAVWIKNLKKAQVKQTPFTIAFIDLNKFKPVNDTYGHNVGDMILKGVADRLAKHVPTANITRLGGDEFCIIFPNQSKQDVTNLITSIKQAILEPFNFENIAEDISVSASFGLASFPEDGTNHSELLHVADKAMYKDKGSR